MVYDLILLFITKRLHEGGWRLNAISENEPVNLMRGVCGPLYLSYPTSVNYNCVPIKTI